MSTISVDSKAVEIRPWPNHPNNVLQPLRFKSSTFVKFINALLTELIRSDLNLKVNCSVLEFLGKKRLINLIFDVKMNIWSFTSSSKIINVKRHMKTVRHMSKIWE